MKKTELITGWNQQDYNGQPYYLITTASGATIWVPKAKFDTNAETITYEEVKAGSEYKSKTEKDEKGNPLTKKRLKDGLNYLCCGKQVVKKFESQEAMLEFIASKGMTNALQLN